MRRTKIVCTLGPASKSEAVIKQMLKNGMNVARINFSHGTHDEHKKTIDTFRKVRDSLGLPAAVMLDTKGPEIRIGTFCDGKAILSDDSLFTLTPREIEGNSDAVSISYSALSSKIKVGDTILLDDGRIELRAERIEEDDIICRVISGGEISNRKGVNVPNVSLGLEYLGERDKADLLFGIENDVDFIAASFVRSKEDVITLRKFLDYHGGHNIKIISKIENVEGVNNFDEILEYSDGIMVARGDMGVEIEFEKLPGLQKKFIRKCYQSGKMVITATQMLETMIHSNTPTRAEITDVANAVFDGTSAIMLSGETAMGDHPGLVVRVMAKIATQAEEDAFEMDVYRGIQYDNDTNDMTNAICDAACTTARDVKASAIIAVTKSGYTARRVSKFRPQQIVVAATPDKKTFHQLSLSWGVNPVMAIFQTDADLLLQHAIDCAKQVDLVNRGDRVVITAGAEGVTDIIKVTTIEENRR